MARINSYQLSVGGEQVSLVKIDFAPDLPPCLTDSEREIALLTLPGLTNEEIAVERERSPNTIANQLASVFGKVSVNSRYEFVRLMSVGCRVCDLADVCPLATTSTHG